MKRTVAPDRDGEGPGPPTSSSEGVGLRASRVNREPAFGKSSGFAFPFLPSKIRISDGSRGAWLVHAPFWCNFNVRFGWTAAQLRTPAK